MTSRAIHEIQSEATRLITVNIPGAIDTCSWVALHRLADQLKDLADRGMYHTNREKLESIASFAMGNHSEPEPR